MASEVTYSNLLSESWQNVYDLINDKSNVADPTTSSAEYRKWIYTREPDIKSTDFGQFPYIIVHPVGISFPGRKTVDRRKSLIAWMVQVEVVTCDREFNGQDGKGATHNDAISDDVLQTFLNVTNRNTLSNNSMKFSDPTATSALPEPIANTLIYRRTIFLPFKTLKEITA
jgi:hypothetical protein